MTKRLPKAEETDGEECATSSLARRLIPSGLTRRDIYRLGGLGLAAVAVPGHRARAATRDWNCYTYVTTLQDAPAVGWERIAKDVAKSTNGALNINFHLGGSLPIKASTITQTVSSGVMQLGDDGIYQGNVPIAGMLQLPMLIVTREQMDKALAVLMPDIVKAYGKLGVLVLAHYYYPLQTAWSKHKIESLADIKGLKMRVTSPEQAKFVRAFGGIPVLLGAAEVPSALDSGVIDGFFSASSGEGWILRDILKYNYRLGPNYFNGFMIVNKSDYQGLGSDTQSKLKVACIGVAPWITKTLFAEETTRTAKMKADGMVVTTAKPADVKLGREKMKDYWTHWAKRRGPEFVSALEKVRTAIGV